MVLALCLLLGVTAQSDSFDDKALSAAKRISASSLDSKLPNRPFADWFEDVVRQHKDGIVWQLSECGGPITSASGESDLRACAEAVVVLPNDGRLIMDISVGTFKSGYVGPPVFFSAVIESGDKFYLLRRLSDLPQAIRSPSSIPLLNSPDPE